MSRNIFSLFLMGLSFGLGPCMASCGPILISYIAGSKKNILKGLGVYLLFSLSRIAVYLFLALAIFFLGKFIIETWLGRFSKYIFVLAGSFLIMLGILIASGRNLETLFILRQPAWLNKSCQFLHKSLLAHDKKSIILMGLIIGILPCGPLLALFGYLGLISKTWIEALIYSFSFGLGTLISPLLILSALAGLIPNFLEGQKVSYYKILSFICGLIIVFLGIQLIIRAYA